MCYQIKKNQQLLKDLGLFQEYFSQLRLDKFLWNTIYQWAEKNTKAECCEFIVSLMMEVYPEIVEPLSYEMSIDEESYFDIDKWQINQPIILKDLFILLDKVEGVQTVNNVEIVNLAGESLGYSKFSYDVDFFEISLRTSIFEILPRNSIFSLLCLLTNNFKRSPSPIIFRQISFIFEFNQALISKSTPFEESILPAYRA